MLFRSSVFSFLLPASKPVVVKKTKAVAAKKTDDITPDVAVAEAELKDAKLAGEEVKEAASTGIKTRAGKSKAAAEK